MGMETRETMVVRNLPLEAPQFCYLHPDVECLHLVLSGRKECMDRKVARELPLLLSGWYVAKGVKIVAKPVLDRYERLRVVIDGSRPKGDSQGKQVV